MATRETTVILTTTNLPFWDRAPTGNREAYYHTDPACRNLAGVEPHVFHGPPPRHLKKCSNCKT
jgi:hypothetical protein